MPTERNPKEPARTEHGGPAVTPDAAPGPGMKSGTHKALTDLLERVDFPTDKRHLRETVGNEHLTINGKETTLQDLLRAIPDRSYRSEADLIEELKRLRPFQQGP